jgi:hypothetical protein
VKGSLKTLKCAWHPQEEEEEEVAAVEEEDAVQPFDAEEEEEVHNPNPLRCVSCPQVDTNAYRGWQCCPHICTSQQQNS